MRDLIASHAPLRGGTTKVRPAYTKTLTPGIQRGPPIGAPPKPNVSGFGGERRSSGTTELLPRKAKRRMWSLRRRGAPFSTIFLQTKKDMAHGVRWTSRAVRKHVPHKNQAKRAATSLAARLSSYSTFRTTPKNSGEPSDAVMRYKNGRLRFISTTGASSGSAAPASIPTAL